MVKLLIYPKIALANTNTDTNELTKKLVITSIIQLIRQN